MDPLLDLSRQAAQGDATATRRLLEAVSVHVYRVVRIVLGPVGTGCEAEDVGQESLVALVGAIREFRGDCSVIHFACRIAARIAVASRRRIRARQEQLGIAVAESKAEFECGAGALAEEPATASRRRSLVRLLLDELPQNQAETLALRFVLGCSLREVAEATGVPENTVRSRIRLAREALQRRIASDPTMAELLEDVG